MKQNIKYRLNGNIINVQFEFCFKCKDFKSCYEYRYASLISPECMEENDEG